jgi:hypothetical protein
VRGSGRVCLRSMTLKSHEVRRQFKNPYFFAPQSSGRSDEIVLDRVDINLVFAEIPPGCLSPEHKQAGSRTSHRFLALLALRYRGRILPSCCLSQSVLSF